MTAASGSGMPCTPLPSGRRGHRKGTSSPASGATGGAVRPDSGTEAQRRCLVTGEIGSRDDLIRFVVSPDAVLVPDLEARLPGRGFWLSARRDVLETAVQKKAFLRAARRSVDVPGDLADRVASLLRARCLGFLGFARRAGLVVAGFDKVQALVRSGRVSLLLEAADGAADGRRKLEALMVHTSSGARVVDILTGAELASVLGREHAVHVAVARGKPDQRMLVTRLVRELDRLAACCGKVTWPPETVDEHLRSPGTAAVPEPVSRTMPEDTE